MTQTPPISAEQVEAAAAGMWSDSGSEISVPWVEAIVRPRKSLIGAEVDYTRRMALAALNASSSIPTAIEGAPEAVAWRYKGPKGGWITVEKKPANWHSEPLYSEADMSKLVLERDEAVEKRKELLARCVRLNNRAETAEAALASTDRLPTREEAANAAALLLRCNGYDLDVWTEGQWPSDTDFLDILSEAAL